MMGFGSDSYQSSNYGGGGMSSNYDPPAGSRHSAADSLNKGTEKKWGSTAGFGGEPVNKAIYGQSSKYDEWKPKGKQTDTTVATTASKTVDNATEEKSKKSKKSKRKHRHRDKSSSSSDDSSDNDQKNKPKGSA